MKIYVKKAIAFILIFALTLLTGCGKDNIYSSSFVNPRVDYSSSKEDKNEISTFSDVEYPSENMQSYDKNTLKNNFGNSLHNSTSSQNPLSSENLQNTPLQSQNNLKNESVNSQNDSSTNVGEAVIEGVIHNQRADITFKGIWISYYEFPFWGKTKTEAEKQFTAMMQKVKAQGYTAVFCHVRANADAFYPSEYFPYAMQLTGKAGGDPGYDPLKIMIMAAKKYGLEFHAWINPYRISNITTNPDELAEGHIAAKWLSDGSNRAVIHENGIYFNPSSTDVQRLVLNGIREILENYKVDGIHFDDYFYPENITEEFDALQYKRYLNSSEKPLSLGDWRRANVSSLVSAIYRLCHRKNVVFGISPAGNMSLDNSHDNYNLLYADIALWMREEGYIDYILPQLYFGYKHPVPKSRYLYLINIWSALPKHKNLNFYIGLGAYRMDEECDDKAEWHNESDLLARQVMDASLRGATGIAVFSYTASTSLNGHNALQIKNMFDAINKPESDRSE